MAITSQEMAAKITKAATNMDRLDDIVNGPETLDVVTDSGPVPSVAKFLAGVQDKVDEILPEVLAARDDSLEAKDAAETAETGAVAAQVGAEAAQAEVEGIADSFAAEVDPIPLTFDGVQTSFELGVEPPSEGSILVFVNGAPQTIEAYTISGSTLVFTEAPPEGSGEARVTTRPLFVGRLQPGGYSQYPNPWLLSPDVSSESSKMLAKQDLVASAGELRPAAVIEYTYEGDEALDLDFSGAPGGSVPGGLYVQHRQTGTSEANNAFTHSILAYALNDASGDNDVIAVSGRVRKNDVPGGVGDAAGLWGSAYQYSVKAGLVMAAEATVYQNVAGNPADDRLNSGSHAASVALHLGSYSTGSPATAIIAADGAGQGVWNYEIVDKNLFRGAGLTGTVGYNCASWDAGNHPEKGWAVGEAVWHIYRGDDSVNVNANQIGLENTSPGGAAGFRAKADGAGNAYIDLMTGDVFRGQFFWDGVGGRVVAGSVGGYDYVLRTNELSRMTLKADGNIVLNAIAAKNYASDSFAAAAGIPIGGLYHNAGALRVRLT